MGTRTPKIAKEDFVNSAWKLGCAGGYDAVKIRAIAEDAGVSGALIYSYYEDKAALMDALRGIGAEVLDARLDGEMKRNEPGALLRLTAQYIGYMREHAWLYQGESKLELNGPQAIHAQCFIRRATLLLEVGDSDLAGHPARARTSAIHLWLALRGIVLVPPDSANFDQAFVDAHAAMCVRGVAPQSLRTAPDAAAGAAVIVLRASS